MTPEQEARELKALEKNWSDKFPLYKLITSDCWREKKFLYFKMGWLERAKRDTLLSALESKDRAIKQLEGKVGDLVVALESQTKRLEIQDRILEENEKLIKLVQSANKRVNELESALESEREKVKGLESCHQNVDETLLKSDQECNILRNRVKDLETEIDYWKGCNLYPQTYREAVERVKELEAELLEENEAHNKSENLLESRLAKLEEAIEKHKVDFAIVYHKNQEIIPMFKELNSVNTELYKAIGE